MSANKDNEGMTTNPLEGSADQKCRICSEPISNAMFAPYCSLKCAKTGTSKRYELLRCFFDFEAKYINPRKKVDAAKSKKLAAKKERKKLKKLARVTYNKYVPTIRQKSRTLLSEALQTPIQGENNVSSVDYMDIACRIEQSLYNRYPFQLESHLKGDYSAKLRDLLFNLGDPNNPDLRLRLFSDSVEPERLPLLSADELASDMMRKWREEEERKHIEENVMLTVASEKKPTAPTANEEVPAQKTEQNAETPKEVPKEKTVKRDMPSADEFSERQEKETEDAKRVAEKERERREQNRRMVALLEARSRSLLNVKKEEMRIEEQKEQREQKEEQKQEEKEEQKEQEPKPEEREQKEEQKEQKQEPEERKEEEQQLEEEEIEEEVHEMIELPLTQDQEGTIAIAMPEGTPLFFRTRVILSSRDQEVTSLNLEPVVYVIGRLGVSTCQSFYDSRKEDTGYDISWILLELSDDNDENELQRLLRNFVSEKRVGVLEIETREKTFYFIPPALDPLTTSPISTLSYVANGCYKQFCHLLYVRRRMHNRPRVASSQSRASRHIPSQPRFTPHSPDSPPPKRPYQMPPQVPPPYPPRYPPQQPLVPYPRSNYPPPNYPVPNYPRSNYPRPNYPVPNYPRPNNPSSNYPPSNNPPPNYPPPNYPRYPPQGPMNYPPRDGYYIPPGYAPPPPGYYAPRGPPRGPPGYPPRGPPGGIPGGIPGGVPGGVPGGPPGGQTGYPPMMPYPRGPLGNQQPRQRWDNRH